MIVGEQAHLVKFPVFSLALFVNHFYGTFLRERCANLPGVVGGVHRPAPTEHANIPPELLQRERK